MRSQLFISLLVFQSAYGQLTPLDSARMKAEYLESTSFLPSSGEAFGVYEQHDGFGGCELHLYSDSTFLEKYSTDLYWEDHPAPDFRGYFSIQDDTIRFVYSRYSIDSSASYEWKQTLLQREATSIQKLNARRKLFIFKKVKRYVCLIDPNSVAEFAKAAFSPNGLPDLNYSDGKTWGDMILVKTASYRQRGK